MTGPQKSGRQAWVEQVMGLPVSIHLRGSVAQGDRQSIVDKVFAELHAVDRMFSTYRPDSDISRLRRGELSVPACDPLVAEVVSLCTDATRRTNGFFDATLGAGPAQFDPSGLVKGWAVERAVQHLAALDGDDYYVNAGGDIALGVADESSRDWRIGIEDPSDGSALLGVLALRYGAIATSGTARRGAHIVNPFTGARATGLASVTVTGASLLWADVYATAAMAAGTIDAFAWPAGYEAMAVTAAGAGGRARHRSLWCTPGWRFAAGNVPA